MELNTRLRKAAAVAAMSAGMLLGGVGLAWAATVIGTSITLDPGAALRTGTTAGNTALIQAYDVDGTAYTTFATLTADNAPTMDLAAGVTLGGSAIATLTGTETFTNKTLTSPRIGTSVLDTNGNVILGISPLGSAVNYLSISNSNTGAPVTLQALGSDTNISMYVLPKGSGGVIVSNGVTNADQLVLAAQTAVTDAGAAGTLTTANLSATRTWTLPDSSGTVSLSGHTHSAADITSGNLLANRLQSSATDLGATNVNVNLSNSNGSYVTNFVTDGGLWGDGLRLTNTQPSISNIDSSVTYLIFTPEASAVNYPQFRSAATGNPVILAAKGTDANVDLTLQGQGTGLVQVNGGLNVSSNAVISGNLMHAIDAGVTAFAGGGQGSAYQITKDITGVSTVATAGDSVKLPVSMAGTRLQIFNRTANSMDIFPASGEQINMGGANVAYALAGGNSALCVCLGPADWECHKLVH